MLSGKGIAEVLEALRILKAQGIDIQLLIYFGKGCTGVDEAREMAMR